MQSVFWIGVATCILGADQDEMRARYNEQVAKDRSAMVAAVEKELARLRKEIRSAPREERAAIRANITLNEKNLASYSDPKRQPVPWLNMTRLQEGRIGEIPEDVVNVVQVADEGELLCKVIGRQRDVYFWISEYPTRGIVDDQTIKPKGLFEVLGTKRYSTATGSTNTVWHLRPFPLLLEQAR
jgi:hypothetical protein